MRSTNLSHHHIRQYALLLTFVGLLATPSSVSAYSYDRSITIDHTQVPNTDQTDFPVLISGTYSYLATMGNGGKVQDPDGYDIGFYSDADCSTGKLDWETESYDASTGAASYWVKIPVLSHTTDTIFYLCYGDPAITNDQSDRAAVWSNGFLGVWHMNANPLTDSTGNFSDSIKDGGTLVPGIAGEATSFSGSTNAHIDTTLEERTAVQGAVTFSMFVNASTYSGARSMEMSNQFFLLNFTGSGDQGPLVKIGGSNIATSIFTIPVSSWHLIGGVFDGSTGTLYAYKDGVLESSTGGHGPNIDAGDTAGLNIGSDVSSGTSGSAYFPGDIDEFRIASVARDADWMAAAYNSESSPSTFYSLGAEGDATGSGDGAGNTAPARVIRLFSGHTVRIVGGVVRIY